MTSCELLFMWLALGGCGLSFGDFETLWKTEGYDGVRRAMRYNRFAWDI